MSIENFIGVPGTAIDIESIGELYEALDILHTQVMDIYPEDTTALDILEEARTKLVQAYPDEILP